MRCAACPADRHAACDNQGCHVALARLRVATVDHLSLDRAAESLRRLKPGEVRFIDEIDEFPILDAQFSRLDIEDGDIVVVRTRSKLSAEQAARWQDGLERLLRAQGYREVGVLILDDCTEVTVEKAARPDTRMAHQLVPASPQPMQGL